MNKPTKQDKAKDVEIIPSPQNIGDSIRELNKAIENTKEAKRINDQLENTIKEQQGAWYRFDKKIVNTFSSKNEVERDKFLAETIRTLALSEEITQKTVMIILKMLQCSYDVLEGLLDSVTKEIINLQRNQKTLKGNELEANKATLLIAKNIKSQIKDNLKLKKTVKRSVKEVEKLKEKLEEKDKLDRKQSVDIDKLEELAGKKREDIDELKYLGKQKRADINKLLEVTSNNSKEIFLVRKELKNKARITPLVYISLVLSILAIILSLFVLFR